MALYVTLGVYDGIRSTNLAVLAVELLLALSPACLCLHPT